LLFRVGFIAVASRETFSLQLEPGKKTAIMITTRLLLNLLLAGKY